MPVCVQPSPGDMLAALVAVAGRVGLAAGDAACRAACRAAVAGLPEAAGGARVTPRFAAAAGGAAAAGPEAVGDVFGFGVAVGGPIGTAAGDRSRQRGAVVLVAGRSGERQVAGEARVCRGGGARPNAAGSRPAVGRRVGRIGRIAIALRGIAGGRDRAAPGTVLRLAKPGGRHRAPVPAGEVGVRRRPLPIGVREYPPPASG